MLHQRSRGRYGAPKIHADLQAEGWQVGYNRVARLMRGDGLRGVTRRKGVVTTQRAGAQRAAPDRVERVFAAAEPDRLWVADITYLASWEGFAYLAVVLDVFSRRVVGWALAGHLRSELVVDALRMALWQRRGGGVIHHSDQGCQYTSVEFGEQCRRAGVQPSMGSAGDCFDNAMAESFFATLECELLDRTTFRTRDQAYRQVFEYIEGWYNPQRRHQEPGQVAPIEYEKRFHAQTQNPSVELSTESG